MAVSPICAIAHSKDKTELIREDYFALKARHIIDLDQTVSFPLFTRLALVRAAAAIMEANLFSLSGWLDPKIKETNNTVGLNAPSSI